MGSIAPEHDEHTETWWRRLLAFVRAQPGLSALLAMAVAGLGISIYLTIAHYDSSVSLVCNTGGLINCQDVTTSAYSFVPGTKIPITIPGMLWFLALGALAALGLRAVIRGEEEDPRLRPATLLLTLGGLLFVLYLVFAEIVKVQRICEWCTVVHLLTLASFLIALNRWQRRDEPALPAPQAASTRHAAHAAAHAGAHTAGRPTPATPQAQQRSGAAPALSRRTRHAANRRPPSAR